METRADSAESALDTVDTRIETAKSDAISQAKTLASSAKNDAISEATTITQSTVNAHAGVVATADTLGRVLINDDYKVDAKDGQAIAASTKAVQPAVDAAKAYADGEINSKIAAADAMRFKGVLNSASDLPTEGMQNGDTYKINFTGLIINEIKVEVGDMIIWNSEANKWFAVQANIDGAVTASSDLTENGIVIGGGNKTVSTVSVGTGLELGANGLGVKLGATNNVTTAQLAVTTGSAGNLIVDASKVNTWRKITIDGQNSELDPLIFGGNFTITEGKVDLAWYTLD